MSDQDPGAKDRGFTALPKPESEEPSAPKRARRSLFELPDGAIAIFFLLLVAAALGGFVATYWPWMSGNADTSGDEDRIAALETRVGQIAAGHAGNAASAAFDDMRRDIAQLKSRIDADEARLTAVENAGGQGDAVDTSAFKPELDKNAGDIAALATRVDTLEKTGAKPDEQVLARLDATDKALSDLKQILTTRDQNNADALAKLGVRVDALEKTAPPADLAERLDSFALKSGVDALSARVEKLENANVAEVMRRAAATLALADLVRATQSGKAFAPELSALKALTPDTPEVKELGQYAGRAVPTRAMLAERFTANADDILAAERRAGAKNWFQRAWANIVGLVTVRPVGDVKGGSISARVARAEYDLKQGDLDRAVREVEAMPKPARDAAGGWLADARTRLAVDADARALATRIVAQLGQPVPAAPKTPPPGPAE